MTEFEEETLRIARNKDLTEDFVREVARLLNSGALDRDWHSRGLLFGIAIENISDKYFLSGARRSKDYRNLKSF